MWICNINQTICRALEADSLLPTVRRRPGTGILMETSAPFLFWGLYRIAAYTYNQLWQRDPDTQSRCGVLSHPDYQMGIVSKLIVANRLNVTQRNRASAILDQSERFPPYGPKRSNVWVVTSLLNRIKERSHWGLLALDAQTPLYQHRPVSFHSSVGERNSLLGWVSVSIVYQPHSYSFN